MVPLSFCCQHRRFFSEEKPSLCVPLPTHTSHSCRLLLPITSHHQTPFSRLPRPLLLLGIGGVLLSFPNKAAGPYVLQERSLFFSIFLPAVPLRCSDIFFFSSRVPIRLRGRFCLILAFASVCLNHSICRGYALWYCPPLASSLMGPATFPRTRSRSISFLVPFLLHAPGS